MFLSDISIRRPIAMSCLIIGLVLLGLNANRKLGLELLPKLDVPTITIQTVYPGASPQEIETDVAKPIEDVVVAIDGLKHVNSSCMENVCVTILEFNLGVNVDIAATDVREKLDLIRSDFPVDVEDPKVEKFDINASPIITLSLTGDVPLDELYDYADNTLRDRITVIPGVADVALIGGAEREVHVKLDRDKLAARGLSSYDVVTVIQNGVRTIPSGRIREAGIEYSVKFDADFANVDDIGNLEVANANGQRCHIRDVGYVTMATEELRQKATIDGRPGISIKVVKKADGNAVQVTNGVREAMARLNEELPGGMELVWITDDGHFIESTNNSAWINVLQGILLTAAILFIFLYNLRTLLVVATTMPVTIIIGLFFMQVVGYTLNTSTLIAIGMSVGVLVTNSIVVLEAIAKRLGQGSSPKEASRLGAGEAAISVIASAGTNIVVLFPLAAMDSRVGLFIAPLANTMLIMTIVSLFISFTLTPLLCSILLKADLDRSRTLLGRMERGWNWGFEKLVAFYRMILIASERRRWVAVLVILAVLGGFIQAMGLAGKVGSSMTADSDRGELFVKMEFPTGYDLDHTIARVQEAEQRLSDLPQKKHILSNIGKVEGTIGRSSEGVYLAQILIKFSERTNRTETIDYLLSEARKRMDGFPEAIITVSIPSIIGGQSPPVEMEIAGDDLATLDRLALQVQGFTSAIDGFQDVDTTVRTGKPEIRVKPRRSVLADMGWPATELGMAMRANLEGIEAGTYKKNARNYDIVVKLDEEEGKGQVREFLFPGAPGHPLLMENLGVMSETLAPVQVTRKDKRRVSKLFANLDHSLPLGLAVNQISAAIDGKGILPPGYNYNFAGDYELMAEAQEGFGEAALMALVLVVLTLAAIMESFKQPFLIFATIPLMLIGMIWALYLTGQSLGIFEIMGGVMMIGIVVNNAILIMDQFNIHVAEGVPRHKAMVTAACERFRPIVMITLAAVLGMVPMAIGRGIGAEIRNGVGIASVGGILVSGVLTLIVIPILYSLFTRKDKRDGQSPTVS